MSLHRSQRHHQPIEPVLTKVSNLTTASRIRLNWTVMSRSSDQSNARETTIKNYNSCLIYCNFVWNFNAENSSWNINEFPPYNHCPMEPARAEPDLSLEWWTGRQDFFFYPISYSPMNEPQIVPAFWSSGQLSQSTKIQKRTNRKQE